MSSFYFYNCHIDASMVDNNAYLRTDGIFNILQTMLTEYLKQYEVDNVSIKNKYNAAWLIAKAKVLIAKLPIWGSNINVKSYVSIAGPVKIILETIATDENDNIIFKAIDEMCPINLEKRRIIRLSDIGFEPKILESQFDDSFDMIDMNNLELVNNINVNYIDIDFTNHTNNVSYIRFIINELGLEFFNKYNITKIDVRYLKESRINDELKIYKKENEDNVVLLIKKEDINVFLVKIDYVNK